MNKSINNSFKKIEFFFFSFFFVHVLFHAVFYQVIVGERDFIECMFLFRKYVKIFYIPVFSIILFLHFLFWKITPVQLYFYYHVWIKCIYKTLKRYTQAHHANFKRKLAHWLLDKFFNDNDLFILRSFSLLSSERYSDIVQRFSFRKSPVLVRREHLMEKNFWPNWAFASVLLFNNLRITRSGSFDTLKLCLEVDLRNQSYGIYNNAGKLFLKEHFLNKQFKSRCLRTSKRIEDFLKSKTSQVNELNINAREMPFRWASGGILPIAVWKGKYWYVLFFRDIEPVGWNIANGASEKKEEYKNLYNLIYREFGEELVLLNREPCIGDNLSITQKLFQLSSDVPLPSETSPKFANGEFVNKHKQLREEHDGLTIQFDKGPEIKPIKTPFEVQVAYHDEKLRDTLFHRLGNVIFNVNPTEFGMEVLLASYFKMDDEDYLLDGEIWELGMSLIRQPVMLLSCDYVQGVFNSTSTLGTYVKEFPYLNCKHLEKIPTGAYKIFGKDIEFRKQRLETLNKYNETKESPEAKRYKKWFENYEHFFKMVKDSKCDITSDEHSPLTMLCPVTWKTIEMICYYKLLQK